jgi:hypothetical protein
VRRTRVLRGTKTRNSYVKARCETLVKYEYKKPMTCVNNMKEIIQQSMKEKGITPEQARKSLGIKRYER